MKVSTEVLSSSEGEYSSDEDDYKVNYEIEGDTQTFSLDINNEKALKKKLETIKDKGDKTTPGVVYLGRIPHGFYEEQMQSYFEQFGTVTKLKLYRNKKTGKPKHFAFIEFASNEVAEIVAETMHNYPLFNRLLQCKIVPQEKINPYMWIGANKVYKPEPYLKMELKRRTKKKSLKQVENKIQKLVKKEEMKRKKLKDLGIDYDFPGYAACVMPKAKHIKFEDSEEKEIKKKKIKKITK
ncbi:RNA-binding domain-containing protein [Rhizophagus irregularis]|nr:RNA-binding domain-containing protein [Rhizophagus irregularis]PKY20295.1 RNA-binding domain-containing protein [Rhizophagus irregularis]